MLLMIPLVVNFIVSVSVFVLAYGYARYATDGVQ